MQPMGNTTVYTYDKLGNVSQVKDPLDNVTMYEYDGLGRKLKEIKELRVGGTGAGALDTGNPYNPDGKRITQYAYDKNGRLTFVTDDNNHVTQYQYDLFGNKVKDIFADGSQVTYTYDETGGLKTMTDAMGTTETVGYDSVGQIIRREIERGEGVIGTTLQEFSYDGVGRLVRSSDNNDPEDLNDDVVVDKIYDGMGRAIEEKQNGRSVKYTYHNAGDRASMLYPSGKFVRYESDGLNRLKRILDGNNLIAAYYFTGKNLYQRVSGNNVTMEINYDGDNRPISMTHKKMNGDLVAGFEYAYDASGNKRYSKRLHNNQADVYQYDSMYQLTHVEYGVDPAALTSLQNNNITNDSLTGIASLTGKSENWQHDGLGNWLDYEKDGAAKTPAFSVMNEMTAFAGQTLTYDKAGNLINDGVYKRKYNFRNKLVQVTDQAGNVTAKYTYDASGRRITKTVNNATTTTIWDGWEEIQEVNGGGQVLATYIHGASFDENLFAESASGAYYYHEDLTGSTYAKTTYAPTGPMEPVDASLVGNIGGYTAFGLQMENLPDTERSFMGRKWDEETNTYYLRHRNFAPETGRFIARDPILYKKQLRNSFSSSKNGFSKYFNVRVYFPVTEDGVYLPVWDSSLYTGQYYDFVRNNPLNYLDPMGLYRLTPEDKASCDKYWANGKLNRIGNKCEKDEKWADIEHYCFMRMIYGNLDFWPRTYGGIPWNPALLLAAANYFPPFGLGTGIGFAANTDYSLYKYFFEGPNDSPATLDQWIAANEGMIDGMNDLPYNVTEKAIDYLEKAKDYINEIITDIGSLF